MTKSLMEDDASVEEMVVVLVVAVVVAVAVDDELKRSFANEHDGSRTKPRKMIGRWTEDTFEARSKRSTWIRASLRPVLRESSSRA